MKTYHIQFKDNELISYNYFQCGSLLVVEVNGKLKINQSIAQLYFGYFSSHPAIDMNTWSNASLDFYIVKMEDIE